tara:strand:+ start:3327 stop:3644 length:318 start_codon:yes stop_codon:yes gene_type:complete
MILIGILSALGLLLLALKIGGRKAIGHDILVDVLITLTLMVCFYGTFAGMTAAMVGGLSASLVLFILRKTMVHEKLKLKKTPVTFWHLNYNKLTPTWEKINPRSK